jgi:hypothetical protein
MLVSVPTISDGQFRLGVIAGAIVLGLGIGSVRFCGSVSLAPKPPPPSGAVGTSRDLLTKSAGAPAVYQDFLSRDATAAGVTTPAYEDMTRKLAFRSDDVRHVLEVGEPSIEVAGLRLTAVHANETLALEIVNKTDTTLGYFIKTEPTPAITECVKARPLPFNAMVIEKGAKETRVECVKRAGMAIAVTKVETVELAPLPAYYLRQVPPALVGIEDRVSKGHVAPKMKEPCSPMVSQAVRTGLERGEIGWRDLADFYSRHRCQTYSFPLGYRAFTEDGQRQIPATSSGM